MEDKQFTQLFDLITRCVTGIRELQTDVTEIKSDVAELKTDVAQLKVDVVELKEGQKRLEDGQARLEKEIQTTNTALDTLAGESIRMKVRIDMLEKELSI